MSLNPSLPNHVINRVQVVPSWIDYHKKQGLGSAATAVRFRLLIDQFNDQSDEDGEQQGCSTDYCPQWGQAPGKFDYTIAEQVDGDECEDQEKKSDIFASEYLHQGEFIARSNPEFSIGNQGICVAGPERIPIAETFGKLLLFAQQNLVCEEGVQ